MSESFSQPGRFQHLPEAGSYGMLSHLFLELRGRGVSLSAMDIEFMLAWQNEGIPAETIADIMLAMADECLTESRPFPSNLVPINRRVRQYIKRMREA